MLPNANLLAWTALLGFPIFAFTVIGRARGRLPLAQTVSALMVGAVIVLPNKLPIDLPALPAFDKNQIASLSVFFACWVHHPERVRWRDLSGSSWLVVVIVIGAYATAISNPDTLVYG